MSVYTEVRSALRHGCWYSLKEYFPDEATAPIIFSHLSGTEPAESYVIINILNSSQIGHHSTASMADTQERISTTVNYEVMAQFSFCGSAAADMASTFNQYINNNKTTREEFRKSKLGFMRKSTLRRAPQLRDTQWVDFWNIDITFSYAINTVQLSDIVENFPIDGITGTI